MAKHWSNFFRTSHQAAVPADRNLRVEFEIDHFELHARPKPGSRTLIFGCSDLDVMAALAGRRPHEITVADRSGHKLASARAMARRHALDAEFVHSERTRCPLADGSFDSVLVTGDLLSHVNDLDRDSWLLAEMKRVLKPAGVLVVSINDGDWRRGHYRPDDFETLPDGFIHRRSQLSEDGNRLITCQHVVLASSGFWTRHVSVERLYGAREMTDLLNRAGFESTSLIVRVPHRLDRPLAGPDAPPRLYFSCSAARQRPSRYLMVIGGRQFQAPQPHDGDRARKARN